jgi:DNA modification methylase
LDKIIGENTLGTLYFGNNLEILREHIPDESVDLLYLDPPFNSKRIYNVFLKTPKGHHSDAQIVAFDDTWHWGEQAEGEFRELLKQKNTDVAGMIDSFRRFLKESDMMAYLTMMANRLVELHRVLKPTGSLYLHCDSTASHYLRVVMDAVFGANTFQNEIIWKRTSSHSDSKRYPRITDTLFFYTKSQHFTWNKMYERYNEKYLKTHYGNIDKDGRRFQYGDLVNPRASRGYFYVLLGCPPPKNGWRMPENRALQWIEEGKIEIPPTGKVPRFKRYLDEMEGTVVSNLWTDIPPLNSQSKDALGYPTQKPVELLERIISASSNKGDLVLDPFCGCGTAIHAAQKLGREWIGIDITHLAISLVENRMKSAFPNIVFEVHGTPKDLEGARDLAKRDKYQFQWWACSLVNAQPYQSKKKGADTGIDGIIYFQDDPKGPARKAIVSVKGGESVTRGMIADLKNTVDREQAQIGLFITLAEPTKPMMTEAVSAGYYESPYMGTVPKIQILTIIDLLSGNEKPKIPDLFLGKLNVTQAQVEEMRTIQKKIGDF